MPFPSAPLYVAISDHYRLKILSGELGPGDRLPTEKDIAQIHGVSRITATRALNELELERLVRRVKGSGTFVTDGEWQSTSNTFAFISLVLPEADAFSSSVLRGIEAVARSLNYLVTFHHTAGDPSAERKAILDVISKGSKGILVDPASATENLDLYSSLMIRRFPFVFLDRTIDGLEPPLVSSDNRQGFRELTLHLLGLGHRRLAFVGTSTHGVSSEVERYRGFCQAHLETGVELLAKPLYTEEDRTAIPEDYRPEAPAEIREAEYLFELLEHLPRTKRPTALMAANDLIASLLISAALKRGLDVPGSYSITGFDDLPFAAHLPVPLTTMAQPTFEIGRTAARELLGVIGGKAAVATSRRLATTLLVRQSTAAPPLD